MTQIKIPFNAWSKSRFITHGKSATSRTKIYGKIGDTFEVDGKIYELTDIQAQKLYIVANVYFNREGCNSPEEFIDVWNDIHPKKKYNSEAVVYLHLFRLVK